MDPSPITLVVLLFLHPNRQAEFEQFEASAACIMRRYRGTIERRISLSPDSDPAPPHEIHIVTFPDRDSFDRYRRDSEIQALSSLRAEAIRQTIVWSGIDCPPFEDSRRER